MRNIKLTFIKFSDRLKLNTERFYQMFQILKCVFHLNVDVKGKGNQGNFNDFPDCSFKLVGDNNQVKIAPSVRLSGQVTIYGNDNLIEIGEGCLLKGNIEIGHQNSNFAGPAENCRLTIGQRVFMGKALVRMSEDNTTISIGDNCAIAEGTKIMCTDVHSILDLDGHLLNLAQKIEIGNHVWIGYDAKIMKNTAIADNCVVAAGAIVTKSFTLQNALIAGVPAKIVKHNIVWDKRSPNILSRERGN